MENDKKKYYYVLFRLNDNRFKNKKNNEYYHSHLIYLIPKFSVKADTLNNILIKARAPKKIDFSLDKKVQKWVFSKV